MCVCLSPKRSDTVTGGPAHDEAPVRVRAPLTHLIHAARRPHLAHAHLGLLLEVVGRSGGTHALILTLDPSINQFTTQG